MAILELDLVKGHLAIELEDTSFDVRLAGLIGAAKRACELATGRFIDPLNAPEGSAAAPFSDADLALLQHAGLIMIGDWFENPAGEGKTPPAVGWILDKLADFSNR